MSCHATTLLRRAILGDAEEGSEGGRGRGRGTERCLAHLYRFCPGAWVGGLIRWRAPTIWERGGGGGVGLNFIGHSSSFSYYCCQEYFCCYFFPLLFAFSYLGICHVSFARDLPEHYPHTRDLPYSHLLNIYYLEIYHPHLPMYLKLNYFYSRHLYPIFLYSNNSNVSHILDTYPFLFRDS